MITLLALVLLCAAVNLGVSLIRRKSPLAVIIGLAVCAVALVAVWGFLDPDAKAVIQDIWEQLLNAFQKGSKDLPSRR